MELLQSFLWLSALLHSAQAAPSYLISAPNILHIGVEETVAVQVDGVNRPVSVVVYCMHEVSRQKCSEDVSFQLNAENDYQQFKPITVSADLVERKDLWKRKVPYISLVAESKELFQSRRMVRVLLSSKQGYIFIQTDKSIYTPNEIVKYRIFTLDHYMKPVSKTIQISIYNSGNMRIYSGDFMSNKISAKQLKLPDIALPGNWRIEVQFASFPMSLRSAQFEVKEFVLPSFGIKVEAERMFYLITAAEFSFTIIAKHTYGEPVEGMAFVRFGIIDEKSNNTFLRGLEQQLSMRNGRVESSILTEKIAKTLKDGQSMEQLLGHYLYMAITVYETSSGEMEETEIRQVKFVSSPYVIDLSKTRRFFTPSTPHSVQVQVSYPNGSPASRVPVQLDTGNRLYTDVNGRISFAKEPGEAADVMAIKVTAGDGSPGKEVSEATMTASIFQSQAKSYLYIDVPSREVDLGSSLLVDLKDISFRKLGKIDYYYYMVISKGKTVRLGKIKRQELTKLQIRITAAMMPALRLVVYYYVTDRGQRQMVANSVWVDVKDQCDGEFFIENKRQQSPLSRSTTLKVTLPDSGSVSMVVVDKAVYILNSKNKLTAKKVFEEMNSYDLGCSYGSGVDTANVFKDAGLTFISNAGSVEFREGYSCGKEPRRQKRSLELQQQYTNKLDEFSDEVLRRCCKDGLLLIPTRKTCEQRAKRVREHKCREAFQFCCDYGKELRKNQTRRLDAIGRSMDGDDDDFFDESSIRIRSNFPHSWLWRTLDNLQKGEQSINFPVPDSITTWEIQAIGMFNSKGICVAEPKEFKVFKKFFISLRLPYSVKRNEQVEIKAVIYNYSDRELEVEIYMSAVDGLCSPAMSHQNARKVKVKENSAYPVFFSIVPLIMGNVPIKVIALIREDDEVPIHDAITKLLWVVGEGVMKTEEKSFSINPHEKSSYDIYEDKPNNQVPDTESYLYIRARGGALGESVDNCLTPDGINKLIRVPRGCAEQTSILMAPTVFAVEYLDKSDQWLTLKPERKDEALQQIEAGYNRILGFKKTDGSYGAWLHYPSSTWLTAFVVKILSIVRTQINVDDQHVRDSVDYLVKGQRTSGYFFDPKPVIHRDMQGGVGGKEHKISITAFVTISLLRARNALKWEAQGSVNQSIEKAAVFLDLQVNSIDRPYVMAITAYALALKDPDSPAAQRANEKLRKATLISEQGVQFWWADQTLLEENPGRVPKASAITVEATSYALLQTLQMKDLTYAAPIVKWLTEQRNYGGGFHSTQDTVIALEALSAYQMATFEKEDLSLKFEFSVPGSDKRTVQLEKRNALVQEELQFPLGSNIHIELSGRGNATLTILKTYQVLEETTNICNHFKLEVNVFGKVEYMRSIEYEQEDYDYSDYGMAADQPIGHIGWFDIRSRKRRALPNGAEDEGIYYEVCAWREPENEDGEEMPLMGFVDITLLSGFEPETHDLDQLKAGAENYIDSYDFKEGRLILYVQVMKIKDCFTFGAKQLFKIGLIQPATATLYDFYNPSSKCTIFYNAPEQSTVVSKLCQDDVCECAESPCPRLKRTFTNDVADWARIDFACYTPIVDYAFKGTILHKKTVGFFNIYAVTIVKIIRASERDEIVKAGEVRHFVQRSSCLLKLSDGQSYLLMGKSGKTKDENGKMQYVLDADSWIEQIPSDEKCQGTKSRKPCNKLWEFMEQLEKEGCQV
ncbi:LOW QUALITY PROTEIN: complement C4 [Callorhinchus milii]|uniref:LOW QUALITY PROTEIN: complement C4 n=1 Tax=Callorhinchus milii TaxID=7868 RepID=UPI001C3F9FB7|nr:LOW QUALITY PROTEIN: complement C4 [Callorhinchus milii]